jgi:eukaryotic-like serine/threonine-protein kinase
MIGQNFGNYRVTRLIGEGGMGVVYVAEHASIGRRAAVKVLRPGLTEDVEITKRFFNEARAANAIRHPGIVEVFDSGTLPSGVAYLVMELLEGESLAARLRRLGRLELTEARAIGVQTASALGAAHAAGIVHRDLKPDNLFLVRDYRDVSGENVKVLDFGIAKLGIGTSRSVSVKTRTGSVTGTPAYMSPEQCRGTKEVDHRTDIYALGVILYEMVAGRPRRPVAPARTAGGDSSPARGCASRT